MDTARAAGRPSWRSPARLAATPLTSRRVSARQKGTPSRLTATRERLASFRTYYLSNFPYEKFYPRGLERIPAYEFHDIPFEKAAWKVPEASHSYGMAFRSYEK